MDTSKLVSIIVTTWSMDEKRSAVMRKSLDTLFETVKDLPVEVLVVDNGGNTADSEHLLTLTEQGKINVYIRNHLNMSFGYGRTQALRLCNGDYIAVCDNDIEYTPGWLEKCISILDKYPDRKIYATPIYNVAHWLPRFWSGEKLTLDGEEIRLNSRAGSNCFVIRRKDAEVIGEFLVHRVAGTKWTEEAIEKGYLAAVLPYGMVSDMGFREGYQINKANPIKEVLSNGKEVYFNVDEYRSDNGGLHYIQQSRFNPHLNLRFSGLYKQKGSVDIPA